jgi:hypothetical protein
MNTNTTTVKESVKGRKPRLVAYLDKFLTKHGPNGTHGMRFHGEKGLADIDAAITALTNLKQSVTVAPVVPVTGAVPVVAPVVAPVVPMVDAPVVAPIMPEVVAPVTVTPVVTTVAPAIEIAPAPAA